MPQIVGGIFTPLRLAESFLEHCRELGWAAGEFLDFIKQDDKYYSFVWVKSSYKRIISEVLTDSRSSILEGDRFEVRKLDYRALLFHETPPPNLVETVSRDSRLSERVAVYDLSPIYKGEGICRRLNKTGTAVFKRFEAFLWESYGITLVSLESE